MLRNRKPWEKTSSLGRPWLIMMLRKESFQVILMSLKSSLFKGELKGATDTALQPGAYYGAQPREGRNQVVAGTPFSRKEQRDLFREYSCRSGQYKLQLSPVTWEGTKHRVQPRFSGNWHSKQKQSHRAWPPSLNLPELISPHPSCQIVENIVCKPKNWYYSFCSTLSKGLTLWLIPGLDRGVGEMPWRAKQQVRQLGSPSSAHPHISQLYC